MENEMDYAAAFGLDEGGDERDVEEVAEEAAGEDTQEGTSEETGESTPEETAEEGGGEESEGNPDGEKQSGEENAAFAAARRKAEAQRDAAIAKARQDAKKDLDEFIRQAGVMNPYTKAPIQSKEEWDEYRRRRERENREELIRKTGMNDAEFQNFVESLPEVQEAKAAQREAQEAKANARMKEQMETIRGMNPAIQDIKDLAEMETYPKLYELVQKGYDLSDAYRLANFEALTQTTAAATRQAAMNTMQGKKHLGKTQGRGTGGESVPADVREMYRALNPDATEAEIRAHYNRSHKRNQ